VNTHAKTSATAEMTTTTGQRRRGGAVGDCARPAEATDALVPDCAFVADCLLLAENVFVAGRVASKSEGCVVSKSVGRVVSKSVVFSKSVAVSEFDAVSRVCGGRGTVMVTSSS
jgi:hypothetical protein